MLNRLGEGVSCNRSRPIRNGRARSDTESVHAGLRRPWPTFDQIRRH
jgi:hypothetical protein